MPALEAGSLLPRSGRGRWHSHIRPRFASPQALYSALPLMRETGKQAHGHPLPHPACP